MAAGVLDVDRRGGSENLTVNASSFTVMGKRDQGGQKLEGEKGIQRNFFWFVSSAGLLACRTIQWKETDDMGEKEEILGNDPESKDEG